MFTDVSRIVPMMTTTVVGRDGEDGIDGEAHKAKSLFSRTYLQETVAPKVGVAEIESDALRHGVAVDFSGLRKRKRLIAHGLEHKERWRQKEGTVQTPRRGP